MTPFYGICVDGNVDALKKFLDKQMKKMKKMKTHSDVSRAHCLLDYLSTEQYRYDKYCYDTPMHDMCLMGNVKMLQYIIQVIEDEKDEKQLKHNKARFCRLLTYKNCFKHASGDWKHWTPLDIVQDKIDGKRIYIEIAQLLLVRMKSYMDPAKWRGNLIEHVRGAFEGWHFQEGIKCLLLPPVCESLKEAHKILTTSYVKACDQTKSKPHRRTLLHMACETYRASLLRRLLAPPLCPTPHDAFRLVCRELKANHWNASLIAHAINKKELCRLLDSDVCPSDEQRGQLLDVSYDELHSWTEKEKVDYCRIVLTPSSSMTFYLARCFHYVMDMRLALRTHALLFSETTLRVFYAAYTPNFIPSQSIHRDCILNGQLWNRREMHLRLRHVREVYARVQQFS
jgi:hypothetical protein